jgi:hypothetical protein
MTMFVRGFESLLTPDALDSLVVTSMLKISETRITLRMTLP